MSVFEYKGVGADGKDLKGIIDADTTKSARAKLKRLGVFPTEIIEERQKRLSKEIAFSQLFGRVRHQDIAILTRQIATLTNAGVPVAEALSAIMEQEEKAELKGIISEIVTRIKEGSSFADALKGYPKYFSNLYVNMIMAGETSGALDIVLLRLADFLDSQIKIRNRIRSALAYPILMTIIGIAVLSFIFTFVLPQVVRVFEDMHQSLPLLTLILISATNFMRSYWWLIIMIIGGIVFYIRKRLNTPEGRMRFDGLVIRLPIFGKLIRMIAISRFTRTLGTLLKSGVPAILSFDIVKNVVNNIVIARAIEDARENIREGESISEPLKRSGLFPSVVTHMIAVGEKSGELEEMLLRVSDAYDNEVETAIARLTSLLEPVIIVAMGIIVGIIVISILLPIMEMSTVIR
ncbi:MAG: type II secretion system inner membrane protein GspF [Nitrospirae bacterium]|nr:type II secretion system inner membrane protein GspF [Nitrospirota bacterium]